MKLFFKSIAETPEKLLIVFCCFFILQTTGCASIFSGELTAEDALEETANHRLTLTRIRGPLVDSLARSLQYYARREGDEVLSFGHKTIPVSKAQESITAVLEKLLESPSPKELTSFLMENFSFFRSTAPSMLITGYYEGNINGSLYKTEKFRYPIYRKPPERLRKFTRDKIDYGGILKNKGLELAWTDDPLALFFLQIQGSGILHLPNGETKYLNYGGQNGYPYSAIGKYMVDKGMLPTGQVSKQSIVSYLKANPSKQKEVLSQNQSYIYFRFGENRAIGSIGVTVSPYSSIATDDNLFPKGALALLKTEVPVCDKEGNIIGSSPFTELVLNQDRGGAIKGTHRVDLFMGQDECAAGRMKAKGELYFLIKK